MIVKLDTVNSCRAWDFADTIGERERWEMGMHVISYQCSEDLDYFRPVPVTRDNRSKQRAGAAHCFRNKPETGWIKMHSAFWDQAEMQHPNMREQRADTFFHELAHVIAFCYLNSKGHDDVWRFCFSAFGFIPERCYSDMVLGSRLRGYKHNKEERQVSQTVDSLKQLGF